LELKVTSYTFANRGGERLSVLQQLPEL
jgi:hypothetical protein